eukprot:TRINITY_DN9799_c0_g1_i1.p1 TRINITY_DN9799_c0_g1~~TRINITY_DN9799_c0_g1_i1.p1  ORF type:complete len:455 (+),score=139.49 TRINITY_DN9799_c0_g1_i1:97-1365(+)
MGWQGEFALPRHRTPPSAAATPPAAPQRSPAVAPVPALPLPHPERAGAPPVPADSGAWEEVREEEEEEEQEEMDVDSDAENDAKLSAGNPVAVTQGEHCGAVGVSTGACAMGLVAVDCGLKLGLLEVPLQHLRLAHRETYPVGSQVQAYGLLNQTEINGAQGVVVGHSSSGGCCVLVRFPPPLGGYSVPARNLTHTPPPAESRPLSPQPGAAESSCGAAGRVQRASPVRAEEEGDARSSSGGSSVGPTAAASSPCSSLGSPGAAAPGRVDFPPPASACPAGGWLLRGGDAEGGGMLVSPCGAVQRLPRSLSESAPLSLPAECTSWLAAALHRRLLELQPPVEAADAARAAGLLAALAAMEPYTVFPAAGASGFPAPESELRRLCVLVLTVQRHRQLVESGVVDTALASRPAPAAGNVLCVEP